MWRAVRGLLVLLLVLACRPARAEAARPAATFALIVGSNASFDTTLAPLHYADDDAARYFDLFRLLGMRTVLLSRIDETTQKLHPQATAEAKLPRRAQFEAATAELAADVAAARAKGLDTVLYFVFAGHGGVDGNRGYVSLEDARLTGDAIGSEVVTRINAHSVHVILDACNSYLVAYSRGPGGERRPAQSFARAVYDLGRDPRVGLLLSTSSATESHEWDAFQAGVFSHEVRSGLYGAADADGDGVVSYREIAAFVQRANQAIENDRFRPHVFARAPSARESLLDLQGSRGRRLTIDGAHAGHYLVEDARGVRLADLHNAPGQSISIVRPPPNVRTYVREVDQQREYVLPPADGPIALADLRPKPPRVASRGALHEAFSRLFALPFDAAFVKSWVPPAVPVEPPPAAAPVAARREMPAEPPGNTTSVRRVLGAGLLVGAAGAIGVGSYFQIHAANRDPSGPEASQAEVAARNAAVSKDRTIALWSFIGGGTAALAGAVLLLWPTSHGAVHAAASDHGGFIGYRASF